MRVLLYICICFRSMCLNCVAILGAQIKHLLNLDAVHDISFHRFVFVDSYFP